MNHPDSLWFHTSSYSPKYPHLSEDMDADVVIIGGGFTGLSTSYFLQSMGYKTVILEENLISWGASGRNAGMLIPGYKMEITSIAKKFGTDAARKMLQLSIDSINLLRETVEKHNIDCFLENCGSIGAAYKEEHLSKYKKYQEFMKTHFNYETHFLTKSEMTKELNSQSYFGGLVDPNGYSFHPLNYGLGLAEATRTLGAQIFERTKAEHIDQQTNSVIIRTPQGIVRAKHLVIATNGYTSGLNQKLKKSIIPIGSYMIATEPLGEKFARQLIPNNRVVSDSKKFLYYFRLTPDYRMLFGGRVDFSGIETPELYDKMHRNMISVFPELTIYKVDYKWGGLVAMTMDQLPHLGKTKEGFHYGIGYSGRGAALSTMIGKLIALNIDGESREYNPLEKIPLKQIPLHSQRNLGLNVVGAYYSLQDKLF